MTGRADKAWKKHQAKPNQKTSDNHIEASKDAFAFVHLLELVEHMTEEIHDLRMAAAIMDDEPEFLSPVMDRPKKNYLN